jgi:hypothetical protein
MPSPQSIRLNRSNRSNRSNRLNRPNRPISFNGNSNTTARRLSFGNTTTRRLSFGNSNTVVGRNGNNLPRIPINLNAINEEKLRTRRIIDQMQETVEQYRKNKNNAKKRNPKTPPKNNTRKRLRKF